MIHKDLDLWKNGVHFVLDIYKTTSDFPKEELFGLVSQLRRASVSVPTNISEGAGRSGPRELLRFLQFSMGSLSEIETLLIISNELGFLKINEYEDLTSKLRKLLSQAQGLKKSLSKLV